MVLGLVREQGHVDAPETDRHTPVPVHVRDLVGPPGAEGVHGDGDEIGRFLAGDVLHPVVQETDRVRLGSQSGKHAQGERLHAAVVDVVLLDNRPDVGFDQQDFHSYRRSLEPNCK